MRTRGFTQDDAHIICRRDQLEGEVMTVIRLCQDMLRVFGFETFKWYISTRPCEKFTGSIDDWDMAERVLLETVERMGLDCQTDEGGGAFYGPKIDLKITDAIGREWQMSTIQFDFNLPSQFDIHYIGSDGNKHCPLVIHRALLGSIERFLGILIEHFSGNLPVWCAPIQVHVMPLSHQIHGYADDIVNRLKMAGVRVSIDQSDRAIGQKIRSSIQQKIPYMVIVGAKEATAGVLGVRKHQDALTVQCTLDAFIARMKDDVGVGFPVV